MSRHLKKQGRCKEMRNITRLDTCILDNQTSKTLSFVQGMRNVNEKLRNTAEKRINTVMAMQKW